MEVTRSTMIGAVRVCGYSLEGVCMQSRKGDIQYLVSGVEAALKYDGTHEAETLREKSEIGSLMLRL